MTGLTAWWGEMGRLLAAQCLAVAALAVLGLGPAVDAAVCQGEAPTAAAHLDADHAGAAQAEPEHGHADGADACAHGHCHHAAPYVPTAVLAASAPSAARGRVSLADASVRVAGRQFGLDRPPRA